MKHIKELELNRIKALEEEYHKQGYEVFLEPAPDQLPDFLKSFQPDMIVLKDEEKKVIEVKTRITLSKNPQTREIARLINEQEGWGTDTVVHGYKSDDFKSDIIQKIIDFTEEIIKQYDEVLSA